MPNSYTDDNKLRLFDSKGTEISMYRFFQLSLQVPTSGGNTWAGNPPDYYGGYSGHTGFDFPAPAGTTIRSTCYGTVWRTSNEVASESMGNYVCVKEIKPDNTFRIHTYMHMQHAPQVHAGEEVSQGTLLGYVGNTGASEGNHLHYEIMEDEAFGPRIDAWAQYSNVSQPEGWTPQVISDHLDGDVCSWDWIQDSSGVDYGPYEGSPAPASYYTAKVIYDVSQYNINSLGHISSDDCGGIIALTYRLRTTSPPDAQQVAACKQWIKTYLNVIPMGFYFYSYLPYDSDDSVFESYFNTAFDFLEGEGVTPDDCKLGVWLDLEDEGPTPLSRDVNIRQVRKFCEIATGRGYVTAGLYANKGYIDAHFNASDLADIPIWVAWLDVSASTAQYWADSLGVTLYLHQYSWTGSVGYGDLDCDRMLRAIPYSGDVPGPSPTPTPDPGVPVLVMPHWISFNPPPGILADNTVLRGFTDMDTDAGKVSIHYTLDGSEPTFAHPSMGWDGLWEGHGLEPHKSFHIRAACYTTAGEVLARASGTYIRPRIQMKAEDAMSITDEVFHETSDQLFVVHSLPDAEEEIKTYIDNPTGEDEE